MTDLLAVALDPATGLRTVGVLLVAKVVLACLRGVKERKFDWRILPGYLVDDVIPYGGGLTLLWVLAQFDAAVAGIYAASLAAVSAMLLRKVWDHAQALFGAKAPAK